jgi:hypothetical protein
MSGMEPQCWPPAEWRDEFARRHGNQALAVYDQVHKMFAHAGYYFRGTHNRKADAASLYPVRRDATTSWPPPLCFRLDGEVEAPFQFLNRYGFERSDREQLASMLERTPGLALDPRRGRPTFPLELLRPEDARQVFFEAYVWGYAQIHQGTGAGAPPPGCEVPPTRQVTSTQVVRDEAVVAWVKKQADGRCELCGEPAPFIALDGEPYLEVHHVKHLADGGPDTVPNTVALCPGCHRRLHHGVDRDECRERLYALVPRLRRT